METLSQRQLNRAVLARQFLIDPAPGGTSIPAVLDAMACLQAQYTPAMYIGLWSRMACLERADLTAALESRAVAQGTLLRSTIHLASAGDYWPFALAVRDARRPWILRVLRDSTAADFEAAAEHLRARLDEEGTLTRRQLEEVVGRPLVNGVGLWLDLVRVPPSGTWERRKADVYAAAEQWLGPPPARFADDPHACVDLVVRRYLHGFGPASVAEAANWAGLPKPVVAASVARMPDLRRFRAEDGTELVDLPDGLLPDPGTPVPVRFLPVWDALLLVHARRALVLAEEYRARIFNTKTPHSLNTFLVGGQVAGTWRYEKGRVEIEPFEPLDAADRRDVEAEAERLAAFHS